MEFAFFLRCNDRHLYTYATLYGQFELHGERVSIEFEENFVEDTLIRGRVTDTSISLFPVGSGVIVHRSDKLVTLIPLPEELHYTGSVFSFIILRVGIRTDSYVLIGAETLSNFTIEVQLRDEWIDGTPLTALVLNSNFPGIRAGTGVVVTRSQWDVTVEELF